MAGTHPENERAHETTGTELGDYGTASTPLVARVAVHAATLAAAVECLAALVAASILGWALTMSPTAGTVPLHALKTSSAVVDLVARAIEASTYASVLVALTILIAGAAVLRWRTTGSAPAADLQGFLACWVMWVATIMLRGGIALGAATAGDDAGLNTLLIQQLATVVVDVAMVVGSVLLARLITVSPTVHLTGRTSGSPSVGAAR